MNEFPLEIFSKIVLFALIDNDGIVRANNFRGLHLNSKFRAHIKGLLTSLSYLSVTETSITVKGNPRPGQKLKLKFDLMDSKSWKALRLLLQLKQTKAFDIPIRHVGI